MISTKELKALRMQRLRSEACYWCIDQPSESCKIYRDHNNLKCIYNLDPLKQRMCDDRNLFKASFA